MTTEGQVKGDVAPIVSTVDATVEQTLAFGRLTAGPLTELAFGLIVLVLIIVLHGWSMGRISRMFARRVARLPDHAPSWRINLLLAITIGLMALTHLTETLLWAAPIYVSGLIPNFRDSYYFVLETYTTLGDANIALPEAWRLIGPLIAISGLFTFSWTGSVLVYVVGEIGRRHAVSEQAASHGGSPPPQDGRDRAG
jgi:hypothetical protein